MSILEDYIGKEVIVHVNSGTGTILANLSGYEKPFIEFENLTSLCTHAGKGGLFMSDPLAKRSLYHQDSIKQIYLASDIEDNGGFTRK